MSKPRPFRRQLRIPGIARVPRGTSLLPSVEREIEFCARKFNCSKSFVVSVALQDFLKITGDDFRHAADPKGAKAEIEAIAKRENRVVRIIQKNAASAKGYVPRPNGRGNSSTHAPLVN